MNTYVLAIILACILAFPLVTGQFFILPFSIMFDIIILFSSARIVKPNTKKRVLLLGKHRRVLESGFHLIIPFLETTTELPVVVAKNSTKEAKETSLKKGEVQKGKKVTNDSYESFRDSFFSRDKK